MCGFDVSLLYVWFRFGCSFGVLVLLLIFWVWDEVISFSISPRERERESSAMVGISFKISKTGTRYISKRWEATGESRNQGRVGGGGGGGGVLNGGAPKRLLPQLYDDGYGIDATSNPRFKKRRGSEEVIFLFFPFVVFVWVFFLSSSRLPISSPFPLFTNPLKTKTLNSSFSLK
jgi:hypothetical protein